MAWLAAEGFQNLRCLTPIRLTLAASLVTLMRAPRQPCSFTPPIHPMPKKSRYQETRATCIEYLLYPNRPHAVRPDVRQVTCAVEEQAEWIATQKAGDAAMAVLGTTSSPLRDTVDPQHVRRSYGSSRYYIVSTEGHSGPTTCQRLVMIRLVKLELSTPDVKCNNATEDKYQAMTMIIHATVQDFRPRVLSDSRPVPHLSPGGRRESGALPSHVHVSSSSPRNDDKNVVLRSLRRVSLLLPLTTIPPLILKYEERFFMRLLTTPQTGMTTSSQV